jgi:hypothetical protein
MASLEQITHHKYRRRDMGNLVHTSRIKIVRVYYGVHGGIKSFYKVEPEKEHAATLDHIVAATAG